jgi:sigma-B regulation protein RsbU (phosphoserine phosphatase)
VGVDVNCDNSESTGDLLRNRQILFIGKKGVSDTRNSTGKRFGTERVTGLLLKWSLPFSAEIANRILAALSEFRGAAKQKADVTLVVVKVAC